MAIICNTLTFDKEGAVRKQRERNKELSLCKTQMERIALKQVWAIEDRPVVYENRRNNSFDFGLFGFFGLF